MYVQLAITNPKCVHPKLIGANGQCWSKICPPKHVLCKWLPMIQNVSTKSVSCKWLPLNQNISTNICTVLYKPCLVKTILQGAVKGGRRQGKQRKRWEDNIREWTGLEFGKSQGAVENREQWRKLVAKSSVVPQRPSRLRDCWWWWLCKRPPVIQNIFTKMCATEAVANDPKHLHQTVYSASEPRSLEISPPKYLPCKWTPLIHSTSTKVCRWPLLIQIMSTKISAGQIDIADPKYLHQNVYRAPKVSNSKLLNDTVRLFRDSPARCVQPPNT